LPYPKGNRDEWITTKDLENRLSSVFSHTEVSNDKEVIIKNFGSLRDYVKKFIAPHQVGQAKASSSVTPQPAAAPKNAPAP